VNDTGGDEGTQSSRTGFTMALAITAASSLLLVLPSNARAKLDRLPRSLKDLLHIMERIGEAGAGFRSLTGHIDTTTPGRADDDADGWLRRVRARHDPGAHSAGLATARGEGRIGGRHKKLDDTKRREIAEAVISGRKTAAQMAARIFGVSPPTVSRIVAAHMAAGTH
jgi:DNA invertase Pin-like site-specific DNA recombinase